MTQSLQAMIFDSVYNSYRGIEVLFRVFNGKIKKEIKLNLLIQVKSMTLMKLEF